MVEEKPKDKGFIDGVETTLTEVELKVNRNNEEQVDKVIFTTGKGRITWKPKIESTSYEGGFKVSKQVPIEKDMLPDKLNKMAMLCNEKGTIKIKVSYNWWKTDQDGEQVIYRFMLSLKTLDKWEILEEKTKEEEVA